MSKIKLLVRVESKLRTTDADGQEQVFPVRATGHLEFAERLISESERQSLVARDYQVAKSEVAGGAVTETSELSPTRHLVTLLRDDEGITRHALAGEMTHMELEVISPPGDLTAAYRLLPNKMLKVGERWQPSHEAIRDLLNFETVGVNETKIELVKIERGLATMKLTGQVQGMAQGAVARVQITGDVRYDLNWRRINWVQLAIDDQREAGPSSPASRSVLEMRMLVEPLQAHGPLEAPAIANLRPDTLREATLLTYDSSSGFRFQHGTDWVPIADQQQRAVLRLVQGDQAIGQCQISRLTSHPAGKQTSLEEFERDVKSALGTRLVKMVSANQAERADGLRLLRAVAQGTVEDVPIQWMYYHVSDDAGSRVSVVFTVELAHLDAFAANDHLITQSLIFTAAPTPAGPTSPTTAASPETAGRTVGPRR
ncbi:MAG: hypothetical protein AAGF97_17945 [Planctomycetota bacterium]